VLGGVYEGHEGLDRWWADLNESFASVRLELDEIIDTGGDQVVTTHERSVDSRCPASRSTLPGHRSSG
jgi:hypothetical protein